jgi:hypothetical protein
LSRAIVVGRNFPLAQGMGEATSDFCVAEEERGASPSLGHLLYFCAERTRRQKL